MEPTYYNPEESKPSTSSQIIDFIETLVVFLAIGTTIYLFVAQPHKVDGVSMFPTFKNNDYIISDKVTYYFSAPKKGDIIVFHSPVNPDIELIKRLIAAPGDKLKIENNTVYINGQAQAEPYIQKDIETFPGRTIKEGEEITVPEGKFLAFGDNRVQSSDSRDWGFLSKSDIVGKVFLRYWPPSSASFNPGAVK